MNGLFTSANRFFGLGKKTVSRSRDGHSGVPCSGTETRVVDTECRESLHSLVGALTLLKLFPFI